jgi:hypothetical protein
MANEGILQFALHKVSEEGGVEKKNYSAHFFQAEFFMK